MHHNDAFFGHDPQVADAMGKEALRQSSTIELIASENIVSAAVRAAQGSVLTNKYAEGYPGRRYYGGCEHVDTVERLAIERACQLFGCDYANVQPHSGSSANQAVFLALLQPGDKILGMDLSAGGHLTHGAAPNLSGKWFHALHYGVRAEDGLIDWEMLEATAHEHRPRLLIAGGSAYPREIDFARMRRLADEIGAYLLADVAHYAGLIVAGLYASPFPHAHAVTTTTHKTLRGPRGGMILTQDPVLAKKIDSAIFPGLQGGPLMHVIAAKALAFGEALQPEFINYSTQVIANAKALVARLEHHGFSIVTGGTDCHMVLLDLRTRGVTGKQAQEALDAAGLTCNKNSVPGDPEKPTVTSGIRLGTPSVTSRGMGLAEMVRIADWIAEVVTAVAGAEKDAGRMTRTIDAVRADVEALCQQFPLTV